MTSDQTLARLIAHMDAQLQVVKEMAEALSAGQSQGRLLAICNPDPPNIELVSMLGRNGITADYDRLNNAYDMLVDELGDWPGTTRSNNIMLRMALGPDAPQFVASGQGWELRSNDGNV